MPTNPTTKSQVQAYRFVLRRMESALVRKDPVMLHEPMRNHLRASAVGLILGLLGLVGFFVAGKLLHQPGKVEAGDIVNIRGTTSVYVILPGAGKDDPSRAIQVHDEASARLLHAAYFRGTAPPATNFVDESALASLPHTLITGLPDAPPNLPDPDKLIKGTWSVCDTATLREELSNAESRPDLSTSALIGRQVGRPLGRNEAFLVEVQRTGAHYLVWNGQRLPVNLRDPAVRLAYRLDGVVPRKVSTSLINAIPQGAALAPPDVLGDGEPSSFPQLSGVQVGDVVTVGLLGQPESLFLVLRQGVQPVEPAVANLILAHGGSKKPSVSPQAIAAVPKVSGEQFADFPGQVPQLLTITETPIFCLAWPSPDKNPMVTVSSDNQLPMKNGVDVPTTSAEQVNKVFFESGTGALVRGVVPDQPANTGQIWLVTDTGLRYAVPSVDVAKALGYEAEPVPAPDSVLRSLKTGATLDPLVVLAALDPELARQQAQQGGR